MNKTYEVETESLDTSDDSYAVSQEQGNENPLKDIKHVSKGWGHEKWIVNFPEYCGKLLYFEKGKRCSWHFHKIKDEVFYLQSGKLIVKYGNEWPFQRDDNGASSNGRNAASQ